MPSGCIFAYLHGDAYLCILRGYCSAYVFKSQSLINHAMRIPFIPKMNSITEHSSITTPSTNIYKLMLTNTFEDACCRCFIQCSL